MKTQLSQLLFLLLIAFFCIAAQSPPQPSYSSPSTFSGRGFASKIEEKAQRIFQPKIPKQGITKRNSPPIKSEKLSVYALITSIISSASGALALLFLYFASLTPWSALYMLIFGFSSLLFAIIAGICLLGCFILAIISLVKQANDPDKFRKNSKWFLVFPLLLLSLTLGFGINVLLSSLALPIIGLIVAIVLFAGLMYLLFRKRKADNKS